MISQEMPGRFAARRQESAELAFLYEHPQWFANIFAELQRRRVPFDKIFIPDHFFDVGAARPGFSVLFNRMSPSADSTWSVLRRSSIRASCRSWRAGRRCSPACCELEDE